MTMGVVSEYARLDALAMADLVRRREVSPTDLLDTALARVDRLNPRLNAVVHRLEAYARNAIAAGLPEGAFTGVPLLVKDLDGEVGGTPFQAGSRSLIGHVSPADTENARRWRASGAVIFGKTNCPEFGLTATTEPIAYGIARNPWADDRSAGGSSGGAGIAVATRMVPLATGGDGGGSIRGPASVNGVFGLKPTRGRTPDGPITYMPWQGLVSRHALTVSVRDSAAFLDATCAPEIGATSVAPKPARPYLEEVTTEPAGLRVALATRPLTGGPIDPECVAAARDAAALMASLGHEVEEAAPTIEAEAFNRAFLTIVAAEAAHIIHHMQDLAGRRLTWRDVETETWALNLAGRQVRGHEMVAAQQCLWQCARSIGDFLTRFDLILTPTLTTLPAPHGASRPQGIEALLLQAFVRLNAGGVMRLAGALDRNAKAVFNVVSSLTPFNAAGLPAMSVPLHWTSANLPVGVQFAARFGDEATLFRVAGQLERARPWADRVPPGCD
jgi:amidase